MDAKLKRKEVWLHPTVVGRLETLAAKKQWSLKQYMEWTLQKESSKAIVETTQKNNTNGRA